MAKPNLINDEITAATSAEISRLIGEFEGKRRAVITEQAALYKARVSGQSLDAVPTPAVAEARKLAATMLNGHAPADFLQSFAPEMPRPGCVWTHTFLIRSDDLPRIQRLERLVRYFRRPTSLEDSARYGNRLLFDE